ncbi:MAG: hypothetical protein CSB48_00125 [Proteobacteria bacterium]|nr:MAG: hypothetical protein CSB48_00125 [Pseudomonadota bacterium]
MAIHICHDGVEVRAPLGACSRTIHQFVVDKSGWVERQLADQAEKRQHLFSMNDGGAIRFMGTEYEIRYLTAIKATVQLSHGSINIHIPGARMASCTQSELNQIAKAQFEAWLRKQARHYMVPVTENYARQLGLSDRLNQVRFRKTRSKWGHCSSRGTIQFNWQIMLAPVSVIDYLVVHEVCHLRYMNHSPQYWQLVGSVCPGYREHDRWLKENEYRLQNY